MSPGHGSEFSRRHAPQAWPEDVQAFGHACVPDEGRLPSSAFHSTTFTNGHAFARPGKQARVAEESESRIGRMAYQCQGKRPSRRRVQGSRMDLKFLEKPGGRVG